jgi:hypothetical protein
MFAAEARSYIEGLIQIQKKISGKGYERDDQQVVNECRKKIEAQFSEYEYRTNEKMARFWTNHREQIRYLIPTANYKGFKNLVYHFNCLDRDSKLHQHNAQLINS